MNKLFNLFSVVVLVALVAGFIWYATPSKQPEQQITTFEQCATAGYAIAESYPRQCRTQDGRLFVEEVGNELEKSDLIQVTSPRPNASVTSPITVTGKARGTWFFEASFPIHLKSETGQVIVSTPAQAQGEWMTQEFVPFTATLEVPSSFSGKAELVLEKDNPSGLPENSDSLTIPIIVKAK